MPYDLLACGSNGSYQLGLGNDDDHSALQRISLPALVNMKPESFAFGGNHTLILFPDGRVFAAGNNEFGQCGIVGEKLLHQFTELPGRWLEIAAGWEFSILRSVDGSLYSCGHGPRGELGHGKEIKNCSKLTQIDLNGALASEGFENSLIRLIKASLNHVVVKLNDDRFIGWGACKKGQLGNINPIDPSSQKLRYPLALWDPQLLDLPPGPFFVVGKERTLVYNERGEILNSLSQQPPSEDALILELSARSDQNSVPQSGLEKRSCLQSKSVVSPKIQCGWSSVHILKDGALSGYGKNSHGQLYNGNLPDETILDFAVGSEHGVFLTKDNSVYAWGWGEHGNCGPGEDPFEHNQLYKESEGDKVVDLACGLATTWIVVERLK